MYTVQYIKAAFSLQLHICREGFEFLRFLAIVHRAPGVRINWPVMSERGSLSGHGVGRCIDGHAWSYVLSKHTSTVYRNFCTHVHVLDTYVHTYIPAVSDHHSQSVTGVRPLQGSTWNYIYHNICAIIIIYAATPPTQFNSVDRGKINSV